VLVSHLSLALTNLLAKLGLVLYDSLGLLSKNLLHQRRWRFNAYALF